MDHPHKTAFFEIQSSNDVLIEILNRSERLGLKSWAVGAGFLQQSVWNSFHKRPLLENIKDVDWVYFDDADLSEDAEANVAWQVQALMSDVPLRFDVKNQARVHLWYERKFGSKIEKYRDLTHALSTWPTTSTAIGVSQVEGVINTIAPFGFSDLMNMYVRPNKVQVTQTIYEQKVARWKRCWPMIHVESWDETQSAPFESHPTINEL